MKRLRSIAAILIAALIAATLAFAAFIGAAGAIAAEAAIHPLRRRVPSNCPTLANADCVSVSIAAADSTRLRAWYFRPRASARDSRAVIVLHGVADSRGSAIAAAAMLVRHGYGVLAPDLRGHGESGGFCTYGIREVDDVCSWAAWLARQERIERIYGLGESLGAAVLIEALPSEPRLRAVAAECAYSSFREIAVERTNRAMPVWMHWMTEPFVAAGISAARVRDDVDLSRASPIDALRRSRTPVLLIHGTADDETSPENSIRLEAANPEFARLWLVSGAAHTMASRAAGTEFERRVSDWFASH